MNKNLYYFWGELNEALLCLVPLKENFPESSKGQTRDKLGKKAKHIEVE